MENEVSFLLLPLSFLSMLHCIFYPPSLFLPFASHTALDINASGSEMHGIVIAQ